MSKFAIIPAFNEEKHIEDVIKQVSELGIKPVVVDDGSFDNTYQTAYNNGAIVLKHQINKGKGEAIKTGLNYLLNNHPEFKYLILIDADNQYTSKEALHIMETLENNKADFVMGYRNWREVPFRHRLGNFVWRNVFNILFNTKLKDTNCGLLGFNRYAVEKIKDKIVGGYIVDNSLLIGALKNNLRISQVPVKVNYHKKSRVTRGVRIVLGVLLYILKEGLKYRRKK